MHDPMTIVKADHGEVKWLLTALAESEEVTEREQMATEVERALSLHMDYEERLVYPLIRKEVGDDDAEEATIEHGLARNGLQTMMSMVAQPGFGAAVEMLKGGIEHHVEEEETELLPELKDNLDRAEWLALGDALAQAKADAGMPVPATRRPTKRSAKRTAGSRK